MNLRNQSKRLLILSLAVLGLLFSGSWFDPALGQETTKPQRKLFVPFDDLDVLLLDASNKRVMLNQKEYQALLDKAKKRIVNLAPENSALIAANYSAKVGDGVTVIEGELKFSLLNEGLISIPLSIEGVAIRSAMLDDEPASLLRSGKQVLLIIDHTKKEGEEETIRTLRLTMMLPMTTTAARQAMSLRLPATTSAKFDIEVPGNVEVKKGAAVIQRDYQPATDSTKFELLMPRDKMNLVMSLNNKQLKDEQVAVTRSVSIHELTPDNQTLHTTCSVDIVNGAMEQIEFSIPEGFQIESVDAETLSQWSVRSTDKSSILVVELREATREDFVLNIKAVRQTSPKGKWAVPLLQPIDVQGQAAVVGMIADARLEAEDIRTQSVIPIDHEFLLDALPPTFEDPSSGTSAVFNVVGAFYSPQAEYQIGMELKTPPAELIIRSNSLVTIGNNAIQLESGLEAVSRFDRKIRLTLALPAGWRITEIQDAKKNPIPFTTKPNATEKAIIDLAKRLGETPTQLFLKAETTPEGWLDTWKEKQVNGVQLKVEDETQHTGSIAIATREDMTLAPLTRKGLELLEETNKLQYRSQKLRSLIGYQFENSDFELQFNVARIEPILLAQAFNFFSVSPETLKVRQEIIFNVKNAGQDSFEFDLPLETPSSIQIQTADGSPIKDSNQEEIEGKRRWTVLLASPKRGNVHLLIDYELPPAPNLEFALTPVVVPQVRLQNSFVVIEGSNELDTLVKNPQRVIDLGELSLAQYTTSRQVIGAYAWQDNSETVSLESKRRQFFPLPGAIVQSAEYVSVVSTDGKLQTAARFAVAAKQLPFLEIELPENSTLWSVQLDQQPAKPQLQDERMLISLLGNQSNSIRDVQIVYETTIPEIGLTGKLNATAPILRVNRSASDIDNWEVIPQVDSRWRLVLPRGYTITESSGPQEQRRTVLESLGDWVQTIGGESNWMPSLALAMEPATSMPSGDSAEETEALVIDSKDASILKEDRDAKPSVNVVENSAGFQTMPKVLPPKKPAQKPIQSWAAKGLRSLNIQLNDNDVATELYQLDGSRLQAQLVYSSRVSWMAAGIAILLLGISVLITNRSATLKICWTIALLILAQALSLLTQTLPIVDPIINLMVLVAVLSAIYFVLAGTFQRLLLKSLTWASRLWQRVGMMATVLMLCFIPNFAAAQDNDPFGPGGRPPTISADEIQALLGRLKPTKLAKVPDDVLIVPFDINDPKGKENADRILISYEEYQRLQQQPDASAPEKRGPVTYVVSSTQYSCELSTGQDELINGEITIDVLHDDPVAVPLNLSGGAFASATVDGEPARLQFLQTLPVARRGKSVPVPSATAILHLEGRGKKVFNFSFRTQPKQQGGWRSIRCRLPVGITRGLTLQTSADPTEVRLNADADRRTIESPDARKIETVLGQNGQLDVQWKPQSKSQAVDQALTINSDAILDVREDGLRLNWHLQFNFRGSERNAFRVEVPADFLVEQVVGDNIRSWNVIQQEQKQFLDITLLGAAQRQEALTVELTQRQFAVAPTSTGLVVPQLAVPSAALHRGTITVRKSPVIELKSGSLRSADRIDLSSVKRRIDVERINQNQSPLGIETFQHYEFRTVPFQVNLEAAVANARKQADIKTILRIGQSRFDLEALINVNVDKRPIHQLELRLPKDLKITRLSASSDESWNEKIEGEFKRVNILFPNGLTGTIPIVLNGELDSFTSVPTAFDQSLAWRLPQLEVMGADSQKIDYAVQTDPAINVIVQQLDGLESTPVKNLSSWLVPAQRPLTKLALRSLPGTRKDKQSGQLKLNRIRPQIEAESVTNIRTTLLAVEETVLLDFQISKAGVRELQFELPEEYRDARINATLVSEKLFTDLPEKNAVVVTLKLQDDVIGNFRVVVELDRELPKVDRSIRLPQVRTGNLKARYVTIQNAGRDEIEVAETEGMQPLNRQLNDYARLKKKLQGAELTLAYIAKQGNDAAGLQFRLNAREAVSTVAASIGFSKTTMVVDHQGTYRAQQVFQVNNRSEPYLDIDLPSEASLLSVLVDGSPVKPVRWTQSQADNRLRIPIVKTAIGDLDYPVVIKYAGALPTITSFAETSFPVVQTVNINVQLSQLHLRLPESFRWMRFGGTMTQVDRAGQLEEDYLTYQAKQIEKLADQLKSSTSESFGYFSKQRAYQNLDKLGKKMGKYKSRESGSGEIHALVKGNNEQIANYRKELQKQLNDQLSIAVDNRSRFNALVVNQDAQVARNQINRAQNYFVESPQTRGLQQAGQSEATQNYTVQVPNKSKGKAQSFDREWFESTNGQKPLSGKRRQVEADAKKVSEAKKKIVQFRRAREAIAPQVNSATQSLRFNNSMQGQSINAQLGMGMGNQAGAGPGDSPFDVGGRAEAGRQLQIGGAVFADDDESKASFGSRFSQQSMPQRVTRTRSSGEVASGQSSGSAGPGNQSGFAGKSVALASLDIQLPERGVDFYFRAPRGTANVTAVPIEENSVRSWTSIGVVALLAIVIWVVGIAVLRVKPLVGRLAVGLMVGFCGLISIGAGWLPLFGLLAMIAAVGIVLGGETDA